MVGDIHDVGGGILNDLAGVYTLGVSPGTVVRNNLIPGIDTYDPRPPYGPVLCCAVDSIGWSLYADGHTSGVSFEKNIVYDTQSAAFHQGSDEGSVEVRNNVFADPKWAQVMRSFEVSTDPNHEAFVFEAQHRHS